MQATGVGRARPLRAGLPREDLAYGSMVPERLPLPGPSFLRQRELRAGDRTYTVGMARPTDGPDGWWLAIVWVADGESVIPLRDLAPEAGPPPEPPLARLGPAVSGALSGLILEDAGRLQMRLATIVPADDPTRPWRAPAALRKSRGRARGRRSSRPRAPRPPCPT